MGHREALRITYLACRRHERAAGEGETWTFQHGRRRACGSVGSRASANGAAGPRRRHYQLPGGRRRQAYMTDGARDWG